MNNKNIFIFLILFLSLKNAFAFGDSLVNPQVRSSPTMISNLIFGNNKYAKVTYGQPFRKNRVVFGDLVPFEQIWRTGANEATEITTNFDFKIAEKQFNQGTYAIFTIPNKDFWKIIINKKLGQWGAFEYKTADDLYVFEAKPITITDLYEAFTIELVDKQNNNLELILLWENTKIVVPFTMISSENSPISNYKKNRKTKE
jgi:hypothetical protein